MTELVTDETLREIMDTLDRDIACDQLLNRLADKNIISKDDVTNITALEEKEKLKELAITLLGKEHRLHPLALKVLEISKGSITSDHETDRAIESASSSSRIAEASAERRILSSSDLSEDWPLKNFLLELSQDISDDEFQSMKDLMHGETGFKTSAMEKRITRPMELFRHLMRSRRINAYNLIFLQALIRSIRRNDLNEKVRAFCLQNNKRPIHFFTSEEKPANGFRHVKFHVNIGVDKLDHLFKEKLRLQVAEYLCVPILDVYIDGIEPCSSLMFTFMVPENDFTTFIHMYSTMSESFQELYVHIRVQINSEQILFSESDAEQETVRPEVTDHLKNLLEREQNLEKQLEERDEELFDLRKHIEEQDSTVDQCLHGEEDNTDLREQQRLVTFYKSLFERLLMVLKTMEPKKQGNGILQQNPSLKAASATQVYREHLAKVRQRGTIDGGLLNKILDAQSVMEAALQEQRFRQMQTVIDMLNMQVLELLERNSILKMTAGIGGPPTFLQDVLAIQDNVRKQTTGQRDTGVNLGGVLQLQLVQMVYPGLRPEEQELFKAITADLNKNEKRKLKSFFDFTEAELKKLKEDQNKLIELVFIKELQKGKAHQPLNVILDDILQKVQRTELVHKYLKQTEEEEQTKGKRLSGERSEKA